MPPLFLGLAILGGLLILVAVLPHLEVRLPRRYRDIIYIRLRRSGGRIDVWRGRPVEHAAGSEFQWGDAEAGDFDPDGVPLNPRRAANHVRRRLRMTGRFFPFQPMIILHAIDKSMGGLTPQDRNRLNRLGAELGDQVLIGDLPNAFPERAFHEFRENGLGPWGAS